MVVDSIYNASEWSYGKWAISLVFIVVFWELTRSVIRRLFSPASAQPDIEENHDDGSNAWERPPGHYVCLLHPPFTNIVYANQNYAHHYETEHVLVTYCVLYKPVGPYPPPAKAGDVDIGNYFKGKKRLWEVRMSIKLKVPPAANSEWVFGLECTDYMKLNSYGKKIVSVATGACRQVLGGKLYHSFGDDPAKTVGEVEKPLSMAPLWAFDQFIETPEGEEPPNVLGTSFSKCGKCRSGRMKEYIKEMEDLQQNLRCGPTYSFACWGPSRFLSLSDWTITLPLMKVSPNTICGRPPFMATVYSRVNNNPEEKRHLPSQLTYYFRVAFWSQSSKMQRNRLVELFGPSWNTDDESGSLDSSRRSDSKRFISPLSCCVMRPKSGVSQRETLQRPLDGKSI